MTHRITGLNSIFFIIFINLLLLQPVLSWACQEGWERLGDSCYYYSKKNRGYSQALTECQRLHSTATLASFNTDEEQTMVIERAKEVFLPNKWTTVMLLAQEAGSSDPSAGWTWSDGTPADLIKWCDDEPNDANGNREDFGFLKLSRGCFNDNILSETYSICEYELPVTTPTTNVIDETEATDMIPTEVNNQERIKDTELPETTPTTNAVDETEDKEMIPTEVNNQERIKHTALPETTPTTNVIDETEDREMTPTEVNNQKRINDKGMSTGVLIGGIIGGILGGLILSVIISFSWKYWKKRFQRTDNGYVQPAYVTVMNTFNNNNNERDTYLEPDLHHFYHTIPEKRSPLLCFHKG